MSLIAAAAAANAAISDIERWRRSYRRDRARRSTGVAMISTVVFAAALWFGVSHAPGWPRVHQTYFNGSVFRSTFPDVLRGLWLNVRILVVGEVLIIVLAVIVAGLRTLTGAVFFPVRVLMTIYVDLFRGMPLIVLLYLIGFGIPSLGISWLPKSPVILGTAALVLTYGAYVAEVLRAGIQSVHPSQRAAGRSLGLTQGQTLRLILLPQGVRAVLPALLNDFVALQKDVGLVSIVGVIDAVKAAQIDNQILFNYTPYVIAALLFVALAVPCARFADSVAARTNTRMRAGAVV
jgi:polar amino acid transport system permease protein